MSGYRSVAISGEGNEFSVRRERRPEITAGVVRKINGFFYPLSSFRTERERKDIGVAVACANKGDGLAIGRNRRLILHRFALDQHAWLASVFQIQRVEIGVSATFRAEH